jgi:S1-C subfamily serine protease
MAKWLQRWPLIAIVSLSLGFVGIGAFTYTAQSQLALQIARIEAQGARAEIEAKVLAAQTKHLQAQTEQLSSTTGQVATALLETKADFTRGLQESRDQFANRMDALEGRQVSSTVALTAALTAAITGEAQRSRLITADLGLAVNALSARVAEVAGETSSLKIIAKRSLIDVGAVYDQVSGGVVRVFVRDGTEGSGFLFGESRRHIVTAAHLVPDVAQYSGPHRIDVKFKGSERIRVSKVWKHWVSDVAVLELSAPAPGATPLILADPSGFFVGQPVLVVGSPFGLEGSVSTGIVSAIYSSNNVIQFDAAANPGNSGGPVLNASGEVMGVVRSGVLGAGGGISFAVTVTAINDLWNRIFAP